MLKNNLFFRLLLFAALAALCSFLAIREAWIWLAVCGGSLVWVGFSLMARYRSNIRKMTFMLNSIDNNDYAFRYPSGNLSPDDLMMNEALNRIPRILLKAKTEDLQKEKYYELIMNSVDTGIVVADSRGMIVQTNNTALRLLGMTVLTHVKQIERIDPALAKTVTEIEPGQKHQVSFCNEKGTVCLAIRATGAVLQEKPVRIIAMNDINNELDDKEIDSWIRLTRILTHEMMNAITPMISLSDTLLNLHQDLTPEVHNGLELIRSTGKGLLLFVDSYRRFTHIPTPQPTLFYLTGFMERMVQLAQHHNPCPNITIRTSVEPDDLILHADENLTAQVILNLLKNAIQAIGNKRADGLIRINARINQQEAVTITVENNGPAIPENEAEHIFVPFFTTKHGGSGVGLSISRQIMRLQGGSIHVNSTATRTRFVLTFP